MPAGPYRLGKGGAFALRQAQEAFHSLFQLLFAVGLQADRPLPRHAEDQRIHVPFQEVCPQPQQLPQPFVQLLGAAPKVQGQVRFWGSMASRTVRAPILAESFQWTVFRLSPGR